MLFILAILLSKVTSGGTIKGAWWMQAESCVSTEKVVMKASEK